MINASKIIDLSHRALFLTATPTGNFVLAASREGDVSIINFNSGAVETAKLKSIIGISIHPAGSYFASIDKDSGALQILSMKGTLLCEIDAPKLLPGTSRSIRKQFEDCLISDGGDHLLAAAHIADDLIAVSLFDLQVVNNSIKASHRNTIEIEDPFIGSSCMFNSAGKTLFPLWLAAGQDGQQLCWFGIEEQQLARAEMPVLENTTPPIFSPSKNWFAVLDEEKTICLWSLLPPEQLGYCEPVDEDELFTESMSFLDETHLLAGGSEALSFVIDTKTMSVLTEIDDSLCTEAAYFKQIGNSIAFVHRRDKGRDLKGWCDSLVFIENKTLLDLIEISN